MSDEYVRQLEDACIILWADLPIDESKLLSDELPALVDFLGHLHHRLEHEQRTMRQNVWGDPA